MSDIPFPYTVDSAALPPSVNINRYDALPTTPYRLFVDRIEDRIKYINSLALTDDDRLSILRGALLGLLEINPDHIIHDDQLNNFSNNDD